MRKVIELRNFGVTSTGGGKRSRSQLKHFTSLAAGGFDYAIPSKKMMHSCDKLGDSPAMFDFKISGLPPPVEVRGSQREYFTSLAAGGFDYAIRLRPSGLRRDKHPAKNCAGLQHVGAPE